MQAGDAGKGMQVRGCRYGVASYWADLSSELLREKQSSAAARVNRRVIKDSQWPNSGAGPEMTVFVKSLP